MTIAASGDACTVSAMELRHLHAFLAVAEERHFGRAAERLGISQPPLSRQIQQLEAELGMELFERSSRAVSLTRAGAAYLEAVLPHLAGLERAAELARQSRCKLEGKVRAGFVSNLAYGLLPRLLKTLKEATPGIAVELSELPSPEQFRALRERRLDIGLVTLPIDDPGLKMRMLFREPIMAMLPAGHPLSLRESIPLRALEAESFVMCPRYRTAGFHEVIVELCRQAGFAPRIDHEASSKAMITELVATGLGISLIPESSALHDHAGVVYRPLSDAPFELEVAAVWLAESMNPVLRAFLDQVILLSAPPEKAADRSKAGSDLEVLL